MTTRYKVPVATLIANAEAALAKAKADHAVAAEGFERDLRLLKAAVDETFTLTSDSDLARYL